MGAKLASCKSSLELFGIDSWAWGKSPTEATSVISFLHQYQNIARETQQLITLFRGFHVLYSLL